MKFYNMGNRPLEHDVCYGSKIVIPKGATGVKIAFRQSPIRAFVKKYGKVMNLNVYIWKNRMYYA